MRDGETQPASYRFGNFELDTRSGELHKNGTRIRLQDQPMQVLLLLLEHAGELVTREQIQKKLWASDTFVDFDNAINSAMRKLREALSDDSGDPRFIETMARRGYRFIGSIDMHPPDRPAVAPEPAPAVTAKKSRAGLIAAVFAAVLVLGAAAGWWLWLRPGPATHTNGPPSTPVPLTAAHGYENLAGFSPDGNQVLYVWDEGKGHENDHLYVKVIGEGKPVQLTSGPGHESWPAWSPDGRTIAFCRILGANSRTYVMPALGGSMRQVGEGQRWGRMSWSPDGRFLAVSDVQSNPDFASLSLIRIENGDRLALTKPPGPRALDEEPEFSPDGRSLLFTRCTGSPICGLYLLDLAADYRPSGSPRLLRQERGDIQGSAWTADGKEVIYTLSADSGGSHHLMRIRAQAGPEPERLTIADGNTLWPAIAKRGNRLAYAQELFDTDIWQVHPGEPPSSFTSSTRDEFAPQYSPDGQHVAFSSDRSGLMQVWVCDGQGGNPVQLTHFDVGMSGTPRWSSDGARIAFDHQDEDGWQIYVMASDGGQVRRLTRKKGDSAIPSWSRDGTWIYYASDQTGRFEVWKQPSEGGGVETQVTHAGGSVAFESGDGQMLYHMKDGISGLWALPLNGGEEKKVLDSVSNRNFFVVEDGIYYTPESATESVRFHSFQTGLDKEIATLRHVADGLTVSPDRKTILFSTNVEMGSNIMVVDNFR